MRQNDDLLNLADVTTALMEKFERRCARIEQQHTRLTQVIALQTQQMPDVVQHSADSVLKTLPDALLEKIRDGLDAPVDAYEQRLVKAGQVLQAGAQALAGEIDRSRRLHQSLIWKMAGATIGSVLLLLIVVFWLSNSYYATIRDNQISADLMKAYNAADVTVCDGRLCANIDPRGKHYGSSGQYLPTRPK